MKLIMYLLGAVLLLGTVGCEIEEEHHHRGGYYDVITTGMAMIFRHMDREHHWYRDRD